MLPGPGPSGLSTDGVEEVRDLRNAVILEVAGVGPELFQASLSLPLVHEDLDHHLGLVEPTQ